MCFTWFSLFRPPAESTPKAPPKARRKTAESTAGNPPETAAGEVLPDLRLGPLDPGEEVDDEGREVYMELLQDFFAEPPARAAPQPKAKAFCTS